MTIKHKKPVFMLHPQLHSETTATHKKKLTFHVSGVTM